LNVGSEGTFVKTGAGFQGVPQDEFDWYQYSGSPFGLLGRHAEGDLSVGTLLKEAYESPPIRLMLLSSALAIPVKLAANATAETIFVIDEYVPRVMIHSFYKS